MKKPKRDSAPKDSAPKMDDAAQSQRFVDMARDLEADENLAAMERAFEKIIAHLPAKTPDQK